MSNQKKLERDLQNKAIGGVCSGLGNYFEMDPTFWRVMFFFLFFLGFSGIAIYAICWIVMPAKKPEPIAQFAQDGSFVQNGNDIQISQKSKKGSMAAGLALIGISAVLLTVKHLPAIKWSIVWPIVIIVVGILLIIPRKSNQS